MKIHTLANRLIVNVNPNIKATLKKFTGLVKNEFYEQTPTYIESEIIVQAQALSGDQLKMVDFNQFQSELMSVITSEELKGVSKPDQYGGDILSFNGHEWLVIMINETYHDHTKAVVMKQVTL